MEYTLILNIYIYIYIYIYRHTNKYYLFNDRLKFCLVIVVCSFVEEITFSLFYLHEQEYLGRDDLSFIFSLKVSPTLASMVLYL